MKRTAVLNVVGLSSSVLGFETPAINRFFQQHPHTKILPAFPAVTCTAQSNYLTGTSPQVHGVVGNGWYNHELSEVQFWKQSNHLVAGRKIWEELRAVDPAFTCAKLFWWYNMYATVDYSITPRPMYPADGRKVFDIYTAPSSIRMEIKKELGEFPFPAFWGPSAGIKSPQAGRDAVTRWISQAAQWIEERHHPTLSLVYLPHLDYNLQRLGPADPLVRKDYQEIDAIVGELLAFFEKRSIQVIILSEYGITCVRQAIHLNRVFREFGWIAIKEELGREILDCGASPAFAVADHQVAHIYVNRPSLLDRVREAVEALPGVSEVLDKDAQTSRGLGHARSGDLVAVAQEDAWFTYYYWFDDGRAPDFARCVDIHRKPGYDPVELFLDPGIRFPLLKIAGKLLKKKLGFRMLMDVIPLEPSLVRGSHGCLPASVGNYPVIAGPAVPNVPAIDSTMVYEVIKEAVAG